MNAQLLLALLSTLVLCTLAVIAWQDWRDRRIANSAVLVLLICATTQWFAAHIGVHPGLTSQELIVNIILALLLIVPGYSRGVLGAGDAKLLLVLAMLWPTTTLLQVFSFGILGLIAGSLIVDHIVAGFPRLLNGISDIPSETPSSVCALAERGIPLGTAIALGALTTLA